MELPPLADCLSVFFTGAGGKAFLSAEVVTARQTEDGWRVRILGGGIEGVSTFTVGRILDTTDFGWRNEGIDMVLARRFSLLAENGYFRATVPPDSDVRAARLALYAEWEASKRGDRILAECNAMKTIYRVDHVERRNSSGMTWIPSAQFVDLLTAFEEGAKWNWC